MDNKSDTAGAPDWGVPVDLDGTGGTPVCFFTADINILRRAWACAVFVTDTEPGTGDELVGTAISGTWVDVMERDCVFVAFRPAVDQGSEGAGVEHDWGRGRTVVGIIGTVSSRSRLRNTLVEAATGPVWITMGAVLSRSSTTGGDGIGRVHVSGSDESFPEAEWTISGHRKSRRVSSSFI